MWEAPTAPPTPVCGARGLPAATPNCVLWVLWVGSLCVPAPHQVCVSVCLSVFVSRQRPGRGGECVRDSGRQLLSLHFSNRWRKTPSPLARSPRTFRTQQWLMGATHLPSLLGSPLGPTVTLDFGPWNPHNLLLRHHLIPFSYAKHRSCREGPGQDIGRRGT